MDIKEKLQQIKATQLQLSELDNQMHELLSKVRELDHKRWHLERASNLSTLKAEVAEELLKDTHKLSDNHEISGDDVRDYCEGFSGNEEIAEEVKYLILPLEQFPIALAEIQEPGSKILLFKVTPPGLTWESTPDWESSWEDKVAYGSTKEKAWAMAYALYCNK